MASGIAHCKNVRELGKSVVVFRSLENKDIQMKYQLNLRVLTRKEVFGGGKWQNDSSLNSNLNREFI